MTEKCFTFVNAKKDRIRQIMESKHMTQQVFAQFLDMSPASLSSIFNGRTKPTLNIVEAIKKKLPDINIDWLIFGTGDMYGGGADSAGGTGGGHDGTSPEPTLDFGAGDMASTPTPIDSGRDLFAAGGHGGMAPNATHEIIREEIKYVEKPARRVVEIRVYYDDLTYETFVPSKK